MKQLVFKDRYKSGKIIKEENDNIRVRIRKYSLVTDHTTISDPNL